MGMSKGENKPKAQRSDLVRDSISTFGTNAIGAVLGLLSAFVVLRALDLSVKGTYNRVQLIGGGLSTLFGFSINSALTYFVSRYKSKNTMAAIRRLSFVVTVLIALAGLCAILFMREIFFKGSALIYCYAAVLYGVFSFLQNICTAILRGENKFRAFNMINLLQKVLITLLLFSMLVFPNALFLVGTLLAVQVLMIGMGVYSIRRWNGAEPPPYPEDDFAVSTGSVMQYSLKSHVSNVLTYVNANMGQYIVNGVSLASLAVYNAAYTMMQQVWLLPDAVSQVIMSRLASMKEHGDKVRLTVFSCKLVTYITFVCAILIILVAQVLVPVIFPQYVGAVVPLRYLIFGAVLICYAKVLANSIAAYGRPELNIIPTVLGIAANIAFSRLLIPAMQINGVALATSLSLAIQGISSIVIFCRFTGTPLYRLLIFSREEFGMIARAAGRRPAA